MDNIEEEQCGGALVEFLSVMYTMLIVAGMPISSDFAEMFELAFKRAHALEDLAA